MSTCPLCGSRSGVDGVAVVFEHPDGQRCEVGPGETITISCRTAKRQEGNAEATLTFDLFLVMENRDGVLKIIGPMQVCKLEGGG